MTDERMALLELVEKEADADLVREMRAFAAERLMELEVEAVNSPSRGRRANSSREQGRRAAAADLGSTSEQRP